MPRAGLHCFISIAPAAAAPAAAPPAPAAAPPAAPAAAVFAGTGFIDCQGAAVDLLAAEGRDGRLRLGVAAHLDEAESLGSAGVAVHDHLGGLHGAVRLEPLL